jgi:hypothetical protein
MKDRDGTACVEEFMKDRIVADLHLRNPVD